MTPSFGPIRRSFLLITRWSGLQSKQPALDDVFFLEVEDEVEVGDLAGPHGGGETATVIDQVVYENVRPASGLDVVDLGDSELSYSDGKWNLRD